MWSEEKQGDDAGQRAGVMQVAGQGQACRGRNRK